MKSYVNAFIQLAPWKKILLVAMMLLVVLTWLAVCFVLTGVISP